MKIKFNISGNQDDPEGNPVPYVRSTRDALWRPEGKRYSAWKDYVQAIFMKQVASRMSERTRNFIQITLYHQSKPILHLNNQKVVMDIEIFWKNRAHGDPDNIWKGICDALFVNDRNVDGSFESQLAPDGKGRVEVKIVIR